MKKHLVPMKRTELHCFVFNVLEQWTKIFALLDVNVVRGSHSNATRKLTKKEKLVLVVSARD